MQKFALHIGAHKTGSTALQAALTNAAQTLRAYRVAAMPRAEIARLFINEKLPEARDVIKGINPGTLILSHEVLLGWPFGPVGGLTPTYSELYPETERRLDFLSDIFAGLDTEVIYYIRDQDTFLESFYIQSVQMGATIPFDAWISEIDMERLSWAPIIAQIRERFPVRVKRYETEFARPQSEAFTRFLTMIVPSVSRQILSQVAFDQPRNRSLNATGLALMTEINEIGLNPKHRTALRLLLQKHLSNTSGDRPTLLSAEQKAVLAGYRAENEFLADSGGVPTLHAAWAASKPYHRVPAQPDRARQTFSVLPTLPRRPARVSLAPRHAQSAQRADS
jgi:hypothetical protein